MEGAKVSMPENELSHPVQQIEEPWYSDCDDTYTGCAMPIGRKAAFWREYFTATLHIQIEYRSDQDALLRDFAEVERQYTALVEDYGMRVTYCEFLCEQTPWGLRQARRLTRKLKAIISACGRMATRIRQAVVNEERLQRIDQASGTADAGN